MRTTGYVISPMRYQCWSGRPTATTAYVCESCVAGVYRTRGGLDDSRTQHAGASPGPSGVDARAAHGRARDRFSLTAPCRRDVSLAYLALGSFRLGVLAVLSHGTAMDVHDQRIAHEMRDRQLRIIAEALPDIVWSTNVRGKQDYRQRRIARVTGLSFREWSAMYGKVLCMPTIGPRRASAGGNRLRGVNRTRWSMVCFRRTEARAGSFPRRPDAR